jgi:hypothetical protein
MKPKKYDSSIKTRLEASVRTFQAIATETEVVLSGQHVVESLKKRATRSKRRHRSQPELARTTRAFALARQRRDALKPLVAEALRSSGSAIDAALKHEFESVRVRNAAVGVATANSALATGSIAELVKRADATERAFDDAIAQAPHTDDEVLPPDGSGDGLPPLPPPTEGGGGGAPDPVSFELYPPDIQSQAQLAYDQQVAPGAELAVQSGSSSFVNLCFSMGIDPNIPSTAPLPQSTRNALAQGVQSIFGDVNNAITGIVVAAALGLGGPVGGGLAALAVILIPRMLSAFEEFVEQLFK